MLKWVIQILNELSKRRGPDGERYFGKVIITYRDGKPVHLEERIIRKPPKEQF
jgi:hypothetical protein